MENSPIIHALNKIRCQKKTKILFGSVFTPLQLKKGQTIQIAIGIDRHLLFLDNGLLTLCQKPKSKNPLSKTIRFYRTGQFLAQPGHYVRRTFSYQLTALTDSLLYQTTYQKLQALYHIDPNIATIILSIQDQWLQDYIEELALLHQPALKRYQDFTVKIGLDHLHIPKKQLANYLLISTKQLGRLTKQLLLRDANTNKVDH